MRFLCQLIQKLRSVQTNRQIDGHTDIKTQHTHCAGGKVWHETRQYNNQFKSFNPFVGTFFKRCEKTIILPVLATVAIEICVFTSLSLHLLNIFLLWKAKQREYYHAYWLTLKRRDFSLKPEGEIYCATIETSIEFSMETNYCLPKGRLCRGPHDKRFLCAQNVPGRGEVGWVMQSTSRWGWGGLGNI